MRAYISKKYKSALLAIHFASVDGLGHKFGRYHDIFNLAIANVDQRIGHILETVERSGLKDSTTILIVGNHAMRTMHITIRINTLIKDLPASFHSAGGSCFLYKKLPGANATVAEVRKRLEHLKGISSKFIARRVSLA